jgi:dolichol-phosphate mannosyltransferase
MKIVVVSPAKNEAEHIKDLMKNLVKLKLDIVLVDDGSSDDTGNIAARYTPYILKHCINLGKGSALRTGCDFAFTFLKADAVILIDSDQQHSPLDIPVFCKQLKQGSELILGVRESRTQMPLLRSIMNSLLTHIFQAVYGRVIPDIPSGYKAFTKKMYKRIKWEGNGYEVEMQIAIKIAKLNLGFKCIPIQTIYHNQARGMTVIDLANSFLKIFLSKLY